MVARIKISNLVAKLLTTVTAHKRHVLSDTAESFVFMGVILKDENNVRLRQLGKGYSCYVSIQIFHPQVG